MDSFSEMMVSLLSVMSTFEKNMRDSLRKEGIERTLKFHPERYSGRKIGTTISTEKFLMKPKSQNIIKDLDNGYTIREIMEMRKCSPSTIDKVKRLRREVYETN